MSRAAQLVHLFVEHATPILAERCAPNRCLNATRVCIDVMRAFGLKARPVSVKALAMNGIFRDRLESLGRWPTEAEMDGWVAEGGWALGIDTKGTDADAANNAWPGHLVAVVQQRWLVDASAIQMRRPDLGILLPDIFVGEVQKPFLVGRGSAGFESESGAILNYMARLDDESWKVMSGFQPHEFNTDMAREIAGRIRRRGT